MFVPDKPIQSQEEDILDRASFAQSLGDAILKYKEKDSIVIGLFGAWGSGKTSIVNMTLERIQSVTNGEQKPVIVNFNPWNFSDQNQLITQFFDQLSATLGRKDYVKEAKELGETLRTYSKFFIPLKLFPWIGGAASAVGDMVKTTADFAIDYADQKSGDLKSIKDELNTLLYEQPFKIIIVIDDIDRLNSHEIRQIFQLVKSLADFPNTVYVLAFDKNVIIDALKDVQKGTGFEYLEKIVQIPFEIPPISKQKVESLLSAQLNELIGGSLDDRWDQHYWENIYYSGFKFLFENIRDITRYINSLRFSFGLIREEVNAADFFAITAIQVFIPELYEDIRDNKDIFSDIFSYPFHPVTMTLKKQAKERADKIFNRANEVLSDRKKNISSELKKFLTILFPKLGFIYGDKNFTAADLSSWRKDRRICSPDFFDRFFMLSVQSGEISQQDLVGVLSVAGDSEAFSAALREFNKTTRALQFLSQLEDFTQDDGYIPKKTSPL